MKVALSKNQEKIVFAPDGPILVRASAGSGKTRIVTERIRHLLKKTQRKILAITFTNKAAEEMAERLESELEIKKKSFIGTFHGFCDYVLRNHGSAIGLVPMPHIFENEADRILLIERAIQETPSFNEAFIRKEKKEQNRLCNDILSFISKAKRELLSEEEILSQSEDQDIVLLFRTYQDLLSAQNAIDFDDLLSLSYRLFTERPNIAELYRRSFNHICVDEGQDLNYAQYQLIKILANDKNRNVFMVGDPNQSIYHFNGSSPDFMNVEFIKDFNPAVHELKENYRSSKKVLEVAEDIMPGSATLANVVLNGEFDIYSAENEQNEAQWIVSKVKELLKRKVFKEIEGPVAYERIAVLARTRYVFRALEEALNENDIPYYFKKAPGSIRFETKEMSVFEYGLMVYLNPNDEIHFTKLMKIINPKMRSNHTGKRGLKEAMDSAKETTYKAIIGTLLDLKEDGSNFKAMIEKLKSSFKEADYFESTDDKMMIINDIDEVLVHWYNFAKTTDNKSLSYFRNAMALGQTHPKAQNNGITLSTVHTMKGLEFDIVFIAGMNEGTFPDYRAIREGDNGLEMKQEKNNAYVAVTRAKRFLYITWPKQKSMPWGDVVSQQISRFIASTANKIGKY